VNNKKLISNDEIDKLIKVLLNLLNHTQEQHVNYSVQKQILKTLSNFLTLNKLLNNNFNLFQMIK
jgi:hypothetical protein